MSATSFSDVVPVLQVAIGPVILISGVGLLLLTMTNRLGRAIDRSRELSREVFDRPQLEQAHVLAQIATIYRRARLLRLTITLAGSSVLLAAVLIIVLFVAALLHENPGMTVVLIFIACLGCLIGSLVTFVWDIHLSLVALRVELEEVHTDLV